MCQLVKFVVIFCEQAENDRQYKGIRVFIVMHCLRNMYSEAARSGLCIA